MDEGFPYSNEGWTPPELGLWQRFWERAEAIWCHRWFAAVLALIGFGGCLWATAKPQSPGVSIGLLALSAGIMSVRPKMHSAEKFAWVTMLIVFAYLEVRAIRRSDEANQKIQQSQNDVFRGIAAGLQTAIGDSFGQYQSTIQHVDGVLGQAQTINRLTKKSLDNITGGSSYIAVIPDVAYSGDEITFSVVNRGQNILMGASLIIATSGIFLPATRSQLLDAVDKRVALPTLHGGERMVISLKVGLPPAQAKGTIETLFIRVSGPNFSTDENLAFRKTGLDERGRDAWEFRYEIYRVLPYRVYHPGEKVLRDPVLEKTGWTTENDPKFPIPKLPSR